MSPYMGAPQQALLSPQTHPVLGAAQSYSYPMTSGLLSAIGNAGGVHPFAQQVGGLNPAVAAQRAQMSQTPTDYTSLALGLAGNPHAGPYSTAGNVVQPGPAANPSAGGTSGSSTGSSILGGLLGALKNPSTLSDLKNLLGGTPSTPLSENGIPDSQTSVLDSLGGKNPFAGSDGGAPMSSEFNSLASTPAGTLPAGVSPAVGSAPTSAELGTTSDALNPINVASGAGADVAGLSSLGAIASGAPADAAVTSALGTVGAQTAGDAAAIQAANDAALGATDGGAAGAGAGGSGSALGTAAAYAVPIAAVAAPALLGHFMLGRDNSSSGYYGVGGITDLAKAVQDATTKYGKLNVNPTLGPVTPVVNPNGTINQDASRAIDDLVQLQVGVNGAFGNLSPYAQKLLNNMGYQSVSQTVAGKPTLPSNFGGGAGGARGLKRY